MTTISLLRDARTTGETVAAIDHVILLGYERTRAERAARPYTPSETPLGDAVRRAKAWLEPRKTDNPDDTTRWLGHVRNEISRRSCQIAIHETSSPVKETRP